MKWKIGDVTVTRVIELEEPTPGRFLLPEASPDRVKQIPWLAPHFATEDGAFILSIHALVVESGDRRIVVDTCLGNDKQRTIPGWNLRSGPFLQQLVEAGHPRESVDTVVCTHLHVDHVGWNTMKQDGRWVPTFPNARYLIGRTEWEYWRGEQDELSRQLVDDSVQPIFDAGLVDLVETDHVLTPEVRLEPSPGHTPGHVSVRISSQGCDAVVTGDLMHHPCQIARPEWGSRFDWNASLARETRSAALSRWSETGTLVIGTHFATPTAGRIVRDGDGFRFVVQE
jgi:glyoxylase-like metal-dependent hydrolase (beta-lactamase superfamily II)